MRVLAVAVPIHGFRACVENTPVNRRRLRSHYTQETIGIQRLWQDLPINQSFVKDQ